MLCPANVLGNAEPVSFRVCSRAVAFVAAAFLPWGHSRRAGGHLSFLMFAAVR